MNIYQLFDENDTTWYVQAFTGEQARDFIEETQAVKVLDWHHLPSGIRNANILVAWNNLPVAA